MIIATIRPYDSNEKDIIVIETDAKEITRDDVESLVCIVSDGEYNLDSIRVIRNDKSGNYYTVVNVLTNDGYDLMLEFYIPIPVKWNRT